MKLKIKQRISVLTLLITVIATTSVFADNQHPGPKTSTQASQQATSISEDI